MLLNNQNDYSGYEKHSALSTTHALVMKLQYAVYILVKCKSVTANPLKILS